MPSPSKRPHWDIYNEEMSQLNSGHALWEPSPLSSFKSIQIGDVGYIRTGCFHPLFSAGCPLGERKLGTDVPQTFKQLQVGVIVERAPLAPGCLCTDGVRATQVGPVPPTSPAWTSPSSVPPPTSGSASSVSFRLTEGRGAALVTQYPTYREDIHRAGTFEKHAKEHYASWVAFARETGHGDVDPILITGVDRTRDFAMLCYSSNRDDLRCEFTRSTPGVTSGWGTWQKTGLVYTNHGPQLRRPPSRTQAKESPSSGNGRTERLSDEDEYDQCVFVRYFTVRKRLGVPRVFKAAAGPHDPGRRGRDGEGSPLRAQYDSDSDSDSDVDSSLLDDDDDGWSSATSVDSESDIVTHNPTADGGRDDFDVIADYIFQNSDAESVLLHHQDITLLREPGVNRDLSIQLLEKQPPITVDSNGVGTIGRQTEPSNLLRNFIEAFKEVDSYRNGSSVLVDGYNLSIPAITAAARYNAPVTVDDSAGVRERLQQSRDVIVSKKSAGKSVYGVSTGYGGSADTRTDYPLRLGSSLLQHQHFGVIPTEEGDSLPLLDPLNVTAMPESWVRGAILIRMNSLIRGHSGVRVELIQQMGHLLHEQITPLVPLHGCISASGDSSPLSYIAGTLIGDPSIRIVCRSSKTSQILPSNKALAQRNIQSISLQYKEHLDILNGTVFSGSVASLALNDAVHLALLAQVLTAIGIEALLGTQASFNSRIHDECRPHPGQAEVARTIYNLLDGTSFATGADHAEEEVNIDEEKGVLKQDRYPLRTSPQFLGPQVEDILSVLDIITLECNSTSDNPLVDGKTGTVHHGGSFRTMAVTNAMEKTCLALHHIGKLLFARATELMNPAMNRGLPPNLAASDPSSNYQTKGVDIGMTAHVAELEFLATAVSTHIQSAEMHNQVVNSLALISGRPAITALDTLTILMSSYLYVLCQALDLRALRAEFSLGITKILQEELVAHFGSPLIYGKLFKAIVNALDEPTTMDCADRMKKVAEACTAPLVNHFSATPPLTLAIANIPQFRTSLASRFTALYNQLTKPFLEGAHGPAPASKYLKKRRAVYEYVRTELKIEMHGKENFERFDHIGMPGGDDKTIGQNITRIYEAIRDGKLQAVVVDTFAN